MELKWEEMYRGNIQNCKKLYGTLQLRQLPIKVERKLRYTFTQADAGIWHFKM